MATLELRNISKSFGDVQAVSDVSFSVEKGELISLLGPSGCGKTTVLRMISGFLKPDSGALVLDGREINHVPPHRRGTGMVYQNYALFPHMTVFENIAFGLKMRRMGRADLRTRVEQVLERTRLQTLADRMPAQLSGGQQQRVALARAVVFEPALLLLDEPLSNLDAKLRASVRLEIRQLQQALNITTLFVTHDQEEALTMSDRIAIMNGGHLEQIGRPADVYDHPASAFVADFVGAANILAGRVVGTSSGWPELHLPSGCRVSIGPVSCPEGEELSIALRPERVTLHEGQPADGDNVFPVTVEHSEYTGATMRYRVRLPHGDPLVIQHFGSPLNLASDMFASWCRHACVNLPTSVPASRASAHEERLVVPHGGLQPSLGNLNGGS